jgi:2-polyprenyl-3-methyl-5-hydroxy-6-metoxy-1,4-benzoquinol methylase
MRRITGRAGLGPRVRVARTLEELDREIARADRAAAESDDALHAALASFRFETPFRMPADPYSEEYRQAQMDLYCFVSGRPTYASAVNEFVQFDLDTHIRRPFPYSTGSSESVGIQFMLIGHLIRAMGLRPGGSVLEFGAGWGKTTLEFAECGYDVTAVDVNSPFIELIRARAKQHGLDVQLVCADMLDYRPAKRFDRVVFFECFHHCSDHVRMIRDLDNLIAPGGAAVFTEPISNDFPYPWGLRFDGLSAWSIRKCGWLELGFRVDYFRDLLARHGWNLEMRTSLDLPWSTVCIARRKREANRKS